MFVDMPPGTGDVPLTVFQSIPVDGIIVVTSPQDLVTMIVGKAVKMAKLMNIPIMGLVENMSYIKCPDCNKEFKIFGDSKVEQIAQEFNLKVLGKLPIASEIAKACDAGEIEDLEEDTILTEPTEPILPEEPIKPSIVETLEDIFSKFIEITSFN